MVQAKGRTKLQALGRCVLIHYRNTRRSTWLWLSERMLEKSKRGGDDRRTVLCRAL
jgi:ERCC4-related helicase